MARKISSSQGRGVAKNGVPEAAAPRRKRKSPGAALTLEYFQERSQVNRETGCWIWTGARTTQGYGAMRFDRRNTGPHRAVYTLMSGEALPSSIDVCHRCDVRLCVNPEHLFAGTRTDNMRDCANKGRLRVPVLKGDACPNSKLTSVQVLAIRADHRSSAELAEQFGVTISAVKYARSGKTWKSVGGPTGPRPMRNRVGQILPWSETDDAFIRANGELGTAFLASRLARTESAVGVRASKLGVRLRRIYRAKEAGR